MPNHSRSSAVARADQIAAEVLRATLGARPRAFGAPHDAAVVQLRKDLARERSIPWALLLRVKLCDVADGVPLERVLADIRMVEAALAAQARARRPRRIRPLALLQQLETVHDARLDAAQLRVAYDQGPEALRELIEAARLHAETVTELRLAAEQLLYAPSSAAA